jgi:hypothetical protein
MLAKLLSSFDSLTFPAAMVGACAALVFLGGHFLIRRRGRRAVLARLARHGSQSYILQEHNSVEDRFKRAQRRAPVPILVSDAQATVEPVAGYVINRSTEGLWLELEEEGQVDPGTQLSVRPAQADETIPWVAVQVKKCQKAESCWHLECEYVRMPTYSVRMLFG